MYVRKCSTTRAGHISTERSVEMIKNNLKKLRGNRTQAEAAAALDMSQGVYSMMESGRAVLNKCELVKAMTYYDVPADKIYPPDILHLCFGIDAAEKKRKPTSAMVKIPIALAERIDGLITDGLYLSRTDFVAAATREKLGGDSNGQNAQKGGMVSV